MDHIAKFLIDYENALATQNWDQVSPLIHANCVATFSEGTYIGKSQVEIAFRKTFDLIKEEIYKITNVHYAISTSDLTVIIYNFHWSGIINGVQSSGDGRGTSTLIVNEGAW